MKIDVEIDEDYFPGDYGDVAGLLVTCSRCGHSVEVFGQETASALRAARMLRDECPKNESNYYVVPDNY